jgi:short subunit dehydrogenase-like uncharacterized protein
MAEPDFDLVLFGATGFVGQLIAKHLADLRPSIRIALAGRSATKLTALTQRLGVDWPHLVVDSAEPALLASSAHVVASTVGPYARYGLPLVQACASAGTGYLDLTGEVLFVRECIDRFEATAEASGARIVNSCGFDSIPSDLGVLLLADQVSADGAGDLTETTLVVRSLKGGVSGGTIDSMRTQLVEARSDRSVRRLLADPYALSPDRDAEPSLGSERDGYRVAHDDELGWTGPFVMAGYNTRIVRRSNALLEHAYGRTFRYREVMGFGSDRTAPLMAAGMTAGLGALALGMSLPVSRSILGRVLPSPGEGPSEKTQRDGRFRVEIHTRTTTDARYVATVAAKGDPGYAATAVMFGQAALSLAMDERPARGGVLTPATALGQPLIERLRGQGFTFEVTRTS